MTTDLENTIKDLEFDAGFKERLLKDLHDDNPVSLYGEEFFDSVELQLKLSGFLNSKLYSNGYPDLYDLDPVLLQYVTDRKPLGKYNGREIIGLFHPLNRLITLKRMKFIDFNATFFHELGHYHTRRISSVLPVEETIAEFHRIYSDISLYQLDPRIGSYFALDLFSGYQISSRSYKFFLEIDDNYEAANAAAIFALNYFDGDLEDTESYLLSAGSIDISKIFFDAVEKDPDLNLRAVYEQEFREILNKGGFRKSLIGEGYISPKEADDYIEFLDFALTLAVAKFESDDGLLSYENKKMLYNLQKSLINKKDGDNLLFNRFYESFFNTFMDILFF